MVEIAQNPNTALKFDECSAQGKNRNSTLPKMRTALFQTRWHFKIFE